MSQRNSGYARKEWDSYETPTWVTEALLPHIPRRIKLIAEPAAGGEKISEALKKAGYFVRPTDIQSGWDFLQDHGQQQAIVTNPPYDQAPAFVAHALALTRTRRGFVAMLLRTDFDHAASRRALFNQPFAKKLVLTKRIVWFEPATASPSFNHAWFIWDWRHKGPPVIAYGP